FRDDRGRPLHHSGPAAAAAARLFAHARESDGMKPAPLEIIWKPFGPEDIQADRCQQRSLRRQDGSDFAEHLSRFVSYDGSPASRHASAKAENTAGFTPTITEKRPMRNPGSSFSTACAAAIASSARPNRTSAPVR